MTDINIKEIIGSDDFAKFSQYVSKAHEIQEFANKMIQQYGSYEKLPREVREDIEKRMSDLQEYDEKYGIKKIRKNLDRQMALHRL